MKNTIMQNRLDKRSIDKNKIPVYFLPLKEDEKLRNRSRSGAYVAWPEDSNKPYRESQQ
jgi:hypothetical protein